MSHRKDIIKTVPYKGKLKFLNAFFVPGMGKEQARRVDKFTEFKQEKLIK